MQTLLTMHFLSQVFLVVMCKMMCSMSGMLFQTEGVYTVHAFQAGLATQPGWSALFCEKMLSHYFLVLRTKEEALLSLFKTFSRWLLAFTIKKLWVCSLSRNRATTNCILYPISFPSYSLLVNKTLVVLTGGLLFRCPCNLPVVQLQSTLHCLDPMQLTFAMGTAIWINLI